MIRFLKKKKIVFFDGYMAVDDPDNIVYRFGKHKVGFFTKEELSIPEGKASEYYTPDWKQVKVNTNSWIENAIKFYQDEERK